ncbi:MAG TPA: hypothetical protein PLN31_03185 [Azoarcus taiwanensis]|nr:hypothetical protein [Azoarcus taiwanensis]
MFKTRLIPERVCICDRCGRAIPPQDHDEDQERLAIDFTAGYASVFGDGNRVQADLCQHCVKKVLGRWLRITEPDDTQPRTPEAPARAQQPYQQRTAKRTEAFFRSLNESMLRRRNPDRQQGANPTQDNEVKHD